MVICIACLRVVAIVIATLTLLYCSHCCSGSDVSVFAPLLHWPLQGCAKRGGPSLFGLHSSGGFSMHGGRKVQDLDGGLGSCSCEVFIRGFANQGSQKHLGVPSGFWFFSTRYVLTNLRWAAP